MISGMGNNFGLLCQQINATFRVNNGHENDYGLWSWINNDKLLKSACQVKAAKPIITEMICVPYWKLFFSRRSIIMQTTATWHILFLAHIRGRTHSEAKSRASARCPAGQKRGFITEKLSQLYKQYIFSQCNKNGVQHPPCLEYKRYFFNHLERCPAW